MNIVLCPCGCGISINERLLARVMRTDTCWEWNGTHGGDGYARIRIHRQSCLVHRLTYLLENLPIPQGLHIDHLCRNRGCVNPAHLEAVTCRVNILRGVSVAAFNARKTHCQRGHPYNEANTYIRLNARNRHCRACNTLATIRYQTRKRSQ
jgi:hypothetical protein